MPQGKSSIVNKAPKKVYSRKNLNVKKGGCMDKAIENPNFAKNLGKMIQNAEGIAAARMAQSGSSTLLKEIRLKGVQELQNKLKLKGSDRDVLNVLKKNSNAKGVRGLFDFQELAELTPALKDMAKEYQKKVDALDIKKSQIAVDILGSSAAKAKKKSSVERKKTLEDELTIPIGVGKKRSRPTESVEDIKSLAKRKLELKEAADAALFANDEELAAEFGADFV